MFSGSVRSNLDPVGFLGPAGPEVDAKLWAALEQVAMADAVRRLPGGLNAPVSEFGESLSVGQRQLLCLARVLLRKCKIILLDEATASLDAASDALVQRTLRDSFPGCTILTIAHRLGTIITADRVLVLDEGRVAQYAHPHELLSATDSVFSALVDELGPAASAAIRERAAESYAARTRTVPSGTGTSNPPQIIP
jgi:ABC-type multidrug transport system fused ATPase/permease subunit